MMIVPGETIIRSGKVQNQIFKSAALVATLYMVATFGDACAVDAKAKPIQDPYALGKRFVEEKKYTDANAVYNKLLSINPHDNAARVGLAESLRRANQRQASLMECKKVLKQDPTNGDAYLVMARVKFDQKDPKALEDINRSIKFNPRNSEAYAIRAEMYYYLGTIDSALDYSSLAYSDCKKALELDPRSWLAYNHRGIFEAEQRRYRDAIGSFSKSIEINPKFANSYKYRGMAYSATKQFDKALKDCNAILSLNPNDADALMARAGIYEGLGQNQKAYDDYTQILTAHPGKQRFYFMRGAIAVKLKKYRQAIDDYSTILKANPLDDDALKRRGDLYFQLGDYQKALADFDEACGFSPDSASNFESRSRVHAKLNHPDLAKKDLARAAQLRKRPAELKI